MCCATREVRAALDGAAVGVFAFVGGDGRPRACPVTPYVDVDDALVSSTLAFTSKVAAVRRDPRVALLAGGCLLSGRATVDIDLTSRSFDESVRSQELRKYPPARQLLAMPGHRRLLWWYVGRASIRVPLERGVVAPGCDRVTLTVLEPDGPRIVALDLETDVSRNEIPVPAGCEGAACLLVHEEDANMADLRQLALHGVIEAGALRVQRRTGSLAPSRANTLSQIRALRALGRRAGRNRPVFERWAETTRSPS